MKSKKLSERVVEYLINRKPYEFAKLNVNAIARYFSVSVSHLSRDFKENVKIGLKRYILYEKINKAKFLLKQDQKLTIKKIAVIFNFCNSDYFIQVFKKFVGITPGRFRKIDKGFYGLKDRRIGYFERRSGIQDRRIGSTMDILKRTNKNFKDQRNGQVNRRLGEKERRNTYKKIIDNFYSLNL